MVCANKIPEDNQRDSHVVTLDFLIDNLVAAGGLLSQGCAGCILMAVGYHMAAMSLAAARDALLGKPNMLDDLSAFYVEMTKKYPNPGKPK